MLSLSLRILVGEGRRIGPGKIDLLEAIAACGSISGAGRRMAMSYKRAWDLVEETNAMFETPVVVRHIGGPKGGGASLTPLGESLVRRYRAIEQAALTVARQDLAALEAELSRQNRTA